MIDNFRFIPVVVINDLSEVAPKLGALCDGGLPCAEITFRTPCAAEAIRLGQDMFPGMCIGAGTVVNYTQCLEALNAGAEFIVSPGLCEDVAQYCRENGIHYIPGCVTPTEIMKALEFDITTVKFFPANIYGGLAAIKALSAPFPYVKFVPTGGIDMSNIEEYLAFPNVAAIGGSFIMKGDIKANTEALMKKLG